MDKIDKLKCIWTDDISHQLKKDCDMLSKTWRSMTELNFDKIYCKGPDGAGQLVLSKKELMDTINFLDTIKDMEEIG